MLPGGFQTARLTFRPITAGDAWAVFAGYAEDAEVARFMPWRPHSRIEDTEAFIAECLRSGRSCMYVLSDRTDGTLRGVFEVKRAEPFRIGFGYALVRASWGQGLMTEALTAVAGWALGQDGVWRVGDVCDIDNRSSARVMEKAGLVREGVLRRWAVHPNIGDEPRDCVSYAITR